MIIVEVNKVMEVLLSLEYIAFLHVIFLSFLIFDHKKRYYISRVY